MRCHVGPAAAVPRNRACLGTRASFGRFSILLIEEWLRPAARGLYVRVRSIRSPDCAKLLQQVRWSDEFSRRVQKSDNIGVDGSILHATQARMSCNAPVQWLLRANLNQKSYAVSSAVASATLASSSTCCPHAVLVLFVCFLMFISLKVSSTRTTLWYSLSGSLHQVIKGKT